MDSSLECWYNSLADLKPAGMISVRKFTVMSSGVMILLDAKISVNPVSLLYATGKKSSLDRVRSIFANGSLTNFDASKSISLPDISNSMCFSTSLSFDYKFLFSKRYSVSTFISVVCRSLIVSFRPVRPSCKF